MLYAQILFLWGNLLKLSRLMVILFVLSHRRMLYLGTLVKISLWVVYKF